MGPCSTSPEAEMKLSNTWFSVGHLAGCQFGMAMVQAQIWRTEHSGAAKRR